MIHPRTLAVLLALSTGVVERAAAAVPLPRVLDERLKIELVAAEPDIVTPTGITVDARGRVLCIENHTHFPKEDYAGLKNDRIKMFVDTDGDHRADKITTYYESTRDTMNLAVCDDGSVYVATRGEIFRLRDLNDDGKADERTRIIELDSTGTYPHDGLSGFAFDVFGHVYFGFGENLGEPYKMIGTDGVSFAGGGEGGSIYRCNLDGSQLERLATGFWNPFHVCLDTYGRLFTVDNDPDWRPPCRLIHVVPGGDYGYRFDLGRRGFHPFTSWFGDFPGTLEMVAGTAEAPGGVISYDSDNLPEDYRHDLITTSWSVHVIERFRLKRKGASFKSLPETIVKGGEDFRPVGVALAPDGSLYFSDWGDYSYPVHGKGRIWRLSRVDEQPPVRPKDPTLALRSLHRPAREQAARDLSRAGEKGLKVLREALDDPMAEVRAAALSELLPAGDKKALMSKVSMDPSADVYELAVKILPLGTTLDPDVLIRKTQPEIAAATRLLRGLDQTHMYIALSLFESDDPFIQQAARYALAETSVKELLKHRTSKSGDVRLNIAILLSESLDKQAETAIPELLKDTDPRVRLVTLKWIAIRRLARFEPVVLAALQSDDLTPKLFDATLACVELLRGSSGQKIEDGLQQMTADLLAEGKLSAPVTALALRKVRGIETKELGSEKTDALSIDQLLKFVNHDDPEVRLEAVRSLRELNDEGRHAVLCGIATDASRSEKLRATAIVGLSPDDVKSRQTLMALVRSDESSLRNEALRSLRGTKLSEAEQAQLRTVASKKHEASELIARLLETDWKPRGRPQPEETDRWMVYAKGGDAAAGERVFFHPQGARCAQCHQIKGRGGVIGPDLSSAGLPGERRLIESIVTPSREMAPRYVPWIIVGVQGQVFTGIFLAERHEDEFYADADGTLHRIDHTHIAESVASTKSLMPDGLVDQLTDQELRDLLAYLKELR